MTDYERDQAANERAHKNRWSVWLFWPTIFLLAVAWNWWCFGFNHPPKPSLPPADVPTLSKEK